MKQERIRKVHAILDETGIDACIIRGMDNIFYLTGFRGSEGMVVVNRETTVLMTDSRYITHAREVARDAVVVEMRNRKKDIGDLFDRYSIKRAGFDSSHTTYGEYEFLRETLDDVQLLPIGSKVEGIRICKDGEEIAAIRKAIDVATEAFVQTVGRLVPGRTEREIANELDYAMRRLGAEKPAFDTIVASGPRAALPHAEPSDREIREGETVIIDFGARVDGYCSDETCTVTVGALTGKLAEIFDIVNEARKLGIDSVKAGMPVSELDRVVRDRISSAGYGEYFRHSTGHGIGIAVHEAPTVNLSANGDFRENMVVTVEPGIYIPGLGGVRLEDMVVIESEGARVLTKIEKDAIRLKV